MIKKTAKRAQGIKAVLAVGGIIGDARFWFELGETAHKGDYSSAVEHAVSQNEALGMEPPDTSGRVNKQEFTTLVHSHMKSVHGHQYLNDAKVAYIQAMPRSHTSPCPYFVVVFAFALIFVVVFADSLQEFFTYIQNSPSIKIF